MVEQEIARSRYSAAEADMVAARVAAEKAACENEKAAAFVAEMEARDGVWDSLKELGKQGKSGAETLIEAIALGAIASKTIFGEPEPSSSVEQLEAIRKREEDEQRWCEEHRRFLESLPPGERILHEKIDALESKLVDRDLRMEEMEEKYKRRISDLERDISELEK